MPRKSSASFDRLKAPLQADKRFRRARLPVARRNTPKLYQLPETGGRMTEAPTIPPRVTATAAALRLIEKIRKDHPEIIFHQSGGCCDGSSPMCYPADEFRLGDVDICLGAVDGVPVYISSSQFDAWRHTQLILDVVPGRGGMFSLDNGREQRFLSRARAFSAEERVILGDT
ncbi:hypothetical protein HOC_04437 [Hyphomonas oceanitis SCH89]|uniref:Acetaldehyde dehydrogenase n=2 Tax=Hyphomonas oceanitis TaxID=81033 RepID=A0A059GB35_9PROT|nr:DUF779 domain-containing protein [Hyphomonas oceanitis]KDA03698.1 hypothetical protein HOC_04437 [Hyphomonas oceanitis SCH89]